MGQFSLSERKQKVEPPFLTFIFAIFSTSSNVWETANNAYDGEHGHFCCNVFTLQNAYSKIPFKWLDDNFRLANSEKVTFRKTPCQIKL